MGTSANTPHREPWNKGKIVGQKAPFKLKDIWALRVRLQMDNRLHMPVKLTTICPQYGPHRCQPQKNHHKSTCAS
jgi:hypothetical protein